MLIHKMSLKYTLVKLLPHLSGASEWSHGNLVPGQISGNPDWCGQVHVSSWFVERQWSGMPSYHDGCYTDHSRYINPHLAEICLTHIKYVFVFPIVFQHCDEGGGWNCSCWKIRNNLSNMFYNWYDHYHSSWWLHNARVPASMTMLLQLSFCHPHSPAPPYRMS